MGTVVNGNGESDNQSERSERRRGHVSASPSSSTVHQQRHYRQRHRTKQHREDHQLVKSSEKGLTGTKKRVIFSRAAPIPKNTKPPQNN